MQQILVDTDVVSLLMKGSPDAEKFKPYLLDRVPCISFVTVAELHYGAHVDNWGDRRIIALEQTIRRYAVLPYDDNLAKLWGKLRARARATGSPLHQAQHTNDLWIATCSIYYETPMLTRNRRHMCDLPDLSFADDLDGNE